MSYACCFFTHDSKRTTASGARVQQHTYNSKSFTHPIFNSGKKGNRHESKDNPRSGSRRANNRRKRGVSVVVVRLRRELNHKRRLRNTDGVRQPFRKLLRLRQPGQCQHPDRLGAVWHYEPLGIAFAWRHGRVRVHVRKPRHHRYGQSVFRCPLSRHIQTFVQTRHIQFHLWQHDNESDAHSLGRIGDSDRKQLDSFRYRKQLHHNTLFCDHCGHCAANLYFDVCPRQQLSKEWLCLFNNRRRGVRARHSCAGR